MANRRRVIPNNPAKHNSFCAGARQYRRDLLSVLSGILDTSGMIHMEKLTANILKQEKFETVSENVATADRKIKQRQAARSGRNTR